MLYVFDGTKNGFLTALVKAFADEDAILSSKRVQLRLGEGQVCVETDLDLAHRTRERLLSFDGHCMNDLDFLLRSGEDDNEQIAFRYFRLLAKTKFPIRNRLAEPVVFKAMERIKRVTFEIHRMHGFIRFMQAENGVLYAPFSPDNDICDLLLTHFRNRLPAFPILLHDIKRQKAAIYDRKHSYLIPLAQADVLLEGEERAWQSLWKAYYASVNIPSRERKKQMRGYMPARYWQFLPELQ